MFLWCRAATLTDMNFWAKLALITVISAVGIGFVTGSVLGGPGRLPDVGAPVLMEAGGEERQSADHDERSDATGGIVHPDPVEQARDWRAATAERRADRREARAALLEARADRRQAREARRPDPPLRDAEEGRDDADDGGSDDDGGDRDDADDDDGGDDDD